MVLHFLASPLCHVISEPLYQHRAQESSLAQGAEGWTQTQGTSVQKTVVLENGFAYVLPEKHINNNKTNNKTQSQINEIPNKETSKKPQKSKLAHVHTK